MKSNLWSRIRAAGFCAAFSLALFLAGCTTAASSASTTPVLVVPGPERSPRLSGGALRGGRHRPRPQRGRH